MSSEKLSKHIKCEVCGYDVSRPYFKKHLLTKKHEKNLHDLEEEVAFQRELEERVQREAEVKLKGQLKDVWNKKKAVKSQLAAALQKRENKLKAKDETRQKMQLVIHPIKKGYIAKKTTDFLRGQGEFYTINMDKNESDYRSAMEDTRIAFRSVLRSKLLDGPIKVNIIFNAMMQNPLKEEVVEAGFHSNEKGKPIEISRLSQANKAIDNIFNGIEGSIQNYTEKGSGWTFYAPVSMYLKIYKWSQPRGGSYVKFPGWFNNKKACTNIKNTDNHCLDYCVANFFLSPVSRNNNPSKPRHYESYVRQNIHREGIKYPVAIDDLEHYCEVNVHLDISINVYHIEEEKNRYYLIYRANQVKKNNLILAHHKGHYVLMGEEGERRLRNTESKDNGKRYFCNYCRLGHKSKKSKDAHQNKCQARKPNKSTDVPEDLYCDNCKNTLKTEEDYNNHREDCLTFDPIEVDMPGEEDSILQFIHWKKKMLLPYVCYLDFETHQDLERGDKVRKEHGDLKHKATSFYIRCIESKTGKVIREKHYRGKECMDVFFSELERIREVVMPLLTENKKMAMTDKDIENHNRETNCGHCGVEFDSIPNSHKVRDHNHKTGEYRAALCNKCNLDYTYANASIPVFVHNLSGYDSHLILECYGKYQKKMEDKNRYTDRIDSIPLTTEKLLTVRFMSFEFKDTLRFQNASLAKLVENLKKDFGSEPFAQTRELFGEGDIDDLCGKLPYAYDFAKTMRDYEKPVFPTQADYHNKLKAEKCSDDEFKRVERVREKFGCKTYGDLAEIYQKLDVTLLADVFEYFRKKCQNAFGLDPAWFVSLPGFGWAYMLMKITKNKRKIELIRDISMYQKIEKKTNTRGGITYVNERFTKIEKDKDEHFLYIDANNLYGWAQSQYLPDGNYKWIQNQEFSKYTEEYIQLLDPAGRLGYFFEIDMDVPQEVHNKLKDLPPAPENRKFRPSPFMSELAEKCNMTIPEEGNSKLTPNLESKTKYVVHYRLLQLYLKLGVKMTKIHSIIQFTQSLWLKEFA
jgi:hypothetical protein